MFPAFHYGKVLKQNTNQKQTHKHSLAYMNEGTAMWEPFAQSHLGEPWGSHAKEID